MFVYTVFIFVVLCSVFFLMVRRAPRSALDRSSAASDVYKRQALVYSADAALELAPEGIKNGTEVALTFVSAKPDVELLRAYPYLRDYSVFKVADMDAAQLGEILKGQIAVVARSLSGRDVDATGVQFPGALDDLYQYEGPLGVTFDSSTPTLRVWAPTAQEVTLQLFDSATASYANKIPMQWDAANGVWSAIGDESWNGKYYLYEVKVFVPSTNKIETNLVTDPYSISLSINSKRSQIVNLKDAALKPEGWDAIAKPALAAPEDVVLYELHIRCLLYTSDAADERSSVDLGGRGIIKKKKT